MSHRPDAPPEIFNFAQHMLAANRGRADKIAYIDDWRHMHYRELDAEARSFAAALGALGFGLLRESAFWWCMAGIALTGVLNLTVSFALAFKVALRSRGIRLAERSRIDRAIRARLRHAPLSFLFPPKDSS